MSSSGDATPEQDSYLPKRPEITVVIPIKSGDADVDAIVAAIGGELDRLEREWECILVFDGVRGRAWAAGLALQESTQNRVRTIALNKAFGDSVCLSSAFEHSAGDCILTASQYVQIDPREIERLLEAYDAGSDFVTPWRYPRIDSFLNRIQSAGFNWVMRRIVGTKFHDLNCTWRVIRRTVLEDLTIYGDMYRYLPAIAFRQGFRVDEVKVRHVAELGGPGIYGPAVYARRLLDILGVMFLTKFTHKPLRFFGSLGGLLSALGCVISGINVVQRLLNPNIGLFERPLFLLGVVLVVLGVQVVGFGLVGEIIIYTQARNLREYRVEKVYE